MAMNMKSFQTKKIVHVHEKTMNGKDLDLKNRSALAVIFE